MPQAGVLIIDDSDVTRLICKNLLKALDVSVFEAESAEKGLWLAADHAPDIINSTLIGAIGSAIMDDRVQMIGLCGAQPAVVELLQRFGAISGDNIPHDFSSMKIKDNFDKTILFDCVRDGLASLA